MSGLKPIGQFVDKDLLERIERIKRLQRERGESAPAMPQHTGSGRPDCPLCGGAGLLSNGVTDVYSPKFGKAVRCSCVLVPHFLKNCGLNAEEQGWEMEYTSNLKGRGNALKLMADVFESAQPAGFVGLFGPFGTGKSGIAKAAVAKACKMAVQGHYTMAQNIVVDSYSPFQNDDESKESSARILKRYTDYPFLVIDELDAMSDTAHAVNFLRLILDARHRDKGSKVTVVISNRYPHDMDSKSVQVVLSVLKTDKVPTLPDNMRWLSSRLQGNFALMLGNDLRATK